MFTLQSNHVCHYQEAQTVYMCFYITFFDARFICQRPIAASVAIIWINFIWSLIFMEDGARLRHSYWFVLLSRYQAELARVSSR